MIKNAETTAQLHSFHMLVKHVKIPQASFQQFVHHEHLDGQVGFRKVRGTIDQIANILRIIDQKNEF